ncbi:hypothetical protein NQZ68_000974, partial [Dissostichus eleginoides]
TSSTVSGTGIPPPSLGPRLIPAPPQSELPSPPPRFLMDLQGDFGVTSCGSCSRHFS